VNGSDFWEPVSDYLYTFTGASYGGTLYGGIPDWRRPSQGVLRQTASGWASLPRPGDIPDTAGVVDMVVHATSLMSLWRWPAPVRSRRGMVPAWTSISGLLSDQAGPLASWGGRLYAANAGVFYGDSALVYRDAGTWRSTGLLGRVTAMTPFGPWLAVGGSVTWQRAPPPSPYALAAWDGARWMALPALPGSPLSPHSGSAGRRSLVVGRHVRSLQRHRRCAGALDWDGFAPEVPADALTLAPNPFQTFDRAALSAWCTRET
jgi:hypothetical protein